MAMVAGEASDQIAMWEAANRCFHFAIMAPCGMSQLRASISDLHCSDARFLYAILEPARLSAPVSPQNTKRLSTPSTRRDAEGMRTEIGNRNVPVHPEPVENANSEVKNGKAATRSPKARCRNRC
jgi:DNA-binding GntR family transcriptional regulator